jgi:hypothetical protein
MLTNEHSKNSQSYSRLLLKKQISDTTNPQKSAMKRVTIASAVSLLSLAAMVLCPKPALAQPVTGDPLLDNLLPANTFPNNSWSAAGSTIGSGPTGFTVNVPNGGFGSLYYALSTPMALDPGLNTATLVLTVNSPVPAQTGDWLGIPFQLGDNSGSVTYGGYAGMFGYAATQSPATVTWNGNTVTETVTLGSAPTGGAAQLADIQAGGDYLYGFNLELDPAVLSVGPGYNVTFDSLTLSSVPEPSSFALFGLGAAALLVLHRRKQRVMAL